MPAASAVEPEPRAVPVRGPSRTRAEDWPSARGLRSRESRARHGKAARSVAPRASHGVWEPVRERQDPVRVLMEQAGSRLPDLVPVRNGRMSASPFAFYRGSAAIMAADLASTPVSGIDVQLCGDAHLSNFGGYASLDRQLIFGLCDFDETLPGPWEWDVKRLVTSLEIAGRDRGLDDPERHAVVRAAASAYREAMREFAALDNLQVWYSRMTAQDIRDRWGSEVGKKDRRRFDRQIEWAVTKDSAKASSKLTKLVNGRTQMISKPPLIVPLSDLLDDERIPIEGIVTAGLQGYRRSLSGARRHLLEQFHYVDAARKVVGVGSVGTRAWVVLMRGTDNDESLILQLKEAGQSVLAPYAGRSRFNNQGQRVVVGQQLLQASSDTFLGWNRMPSLDGASRDFYIRQLWDWKLSADVEKQSRATMAIYGQMCGWTLARAHARSGDRIAIAAYLGLGDVFDVAMVEFAEAYADQNEEDYARWLDAIRAEEVAVTLDL